MKKILQVSFKYNMSADELFKLYKDGAPEFVRMKGLEWKIWLHDAEKKMSGGIYLFTDMESLEACLRDLRLTFEEMGSALSNIDIKVFDVLSELSRLTRAPI